MTSQLVWISNTGDPTIAHESAYDHLTLEELIELHAKVSARLKDPAYVPCDNLSDALCCDDCGLSEMVSEIQYRLRLSPEASERLDTLATVNRSRPLAWTPPTDDGTSGPYRIGAV